MESTVLITNEYPFENGETYIAPELEYAHRTKKIIVIPIGVKDDAPHRSLPENIQLLLPQEKKSSRICLLIQSLFSSPFINGIKELLSQRKLNRRTIKELFKFVYASKVHYATIQKTLNGNGIFDFSNLTFYSYWMDSTSLSISYFKKFGCKAVTRCHGGDLYDERTPWQHQFLRKYITEHIDWVCPVSIQGKEYLYDRIGLHDNIVPMHLGILDNGVGTWQNDEIPIIVSCSNIIPLKRLDLIIKALSFVKSKYKWVHFGDGSDCENIREYAAKSLHCESYELKGQKPNEEVAQFYKNNNVKMFINASATEGVPVSIMEALSFGIPVIATDVGGVGEQITSGYNGVLVDKDISAEDLALLIDEMICLNENDYLDLRKNARNSYCENWNYQKNYSEFYSMLNM